MKACKWKLYAAAINESVALIVFAKFEELLTIPNNYLPVYQEEFINLGHFKKHETINLFILLGVHRVPVHI